MSSANANNNSHSTSPLTPPTPGANASFLTVPANENSGNLSSLAASASEAPILMARNLVMVEGNTLFRGNTLDAAMSELSVLPKDSMSQLGNRGIASTSQAPVPMPGSNQAKRPQMEEEKEEYL
ncbi:uncharacterized protein SPSC_00654 [Sporisorium scitamineum]|uniref:Uncharacterized protein n=1 Tax=Sporisorium scitamineum TaxID=49012 RepID=A0A127Z7E8_9BASI|nr:uncharacterized protein SPSC_00654 [Sporisorium scitamineum]